MRKLISPGLVAVPCALLLALMSQPPHKNRGLQVNPPLLPRAELIHALGAAYIHMIADYYWILTTEATGAAVTADDYKNIYSYADLVSDLDPQFRFVYVFAGVMIPFNYGRETWVNTDESTKILEKGLKYFPNFVYLRIMLAYNYSYFEGRLRQAADLLSETTHMPGAPAYLGRLATRLYAQTGATDAGLALANALLASASDPETRETFKKRKKELMLERVLQNVDMAIARYRQRTGRSPTTIVELIGENELQELPLDPLGGTIVIGADGRSQSTASPRLEVYDPRKELAKNNEP